MKDSCIFSSCRIHMITSQYDDTYALMKRTLLQELFTVPYRVTLLMTLQSTVTRGYTVPLQSCKIYKLASYIAINRRSLGDMAKLPKHCLSVSFNLKWAQ